MNNAKLFSDEAANIYERAISTLLKKNMLLYFAYADYEEVSKNNYNFLINGFFTVGLDFFFGCLFAKNIALVDKDDAK